MTTDHHKVQALIETMTAAFQGKNIDAVMATYEPGAAIAFEPGKPVTDAATARQMFAGMAGVNPVFEYSGHEVIVAGDIAVHIAPWDMTGHAPDGQTVKQSGLSVAILRKQPDGNWKMVIDNPHGSHLMVK